MNVSRPLEAVHKVRDGLDNVRPNENWTEDEVTVHRRMLKLGGVAFFLVGAAFAFGAAERSDNYHATHSGGFLPTVSSHMLEFLPVACDIAACTGASVCAAGLIVMSRRFGSESGSINTTPAVDTM